MSKNKKNNNSYNNRNVNDTNVIMNEYSESSDNNSDMVPDTVIEEVTTDNTVEVIEEATSEIIENIKVDNIEAPIDAVNNNNTDVDFIGDDDTPEIVEPVEMSVKIDETPKVVKTEKVNFYKVGTDFINGKCINQVTATSDLVMAKDACMNARNNFKKSYYVFDNSGNAVYTAEYTTPKDNYYRVGTDWKNGTCINQKFTTVSIDDACLSANDNTKITGMIHHVFDPSGKVVFSAKKKLILLSYKKRGNKNVNWYT